WRLTTGPQPQLVVSCALDLDGSRVILDHAKTIVRSHSDLASAVELRADSIVVPSTGSRWLIRSREHTASRGLHPDVILYDEVGWARDDELFSSLLASQASVTDPLMLVVSTVGRSKTGPLGRVKELAESGDGHTFWHYRSSNASPLVTAEFLARQKRLLMPQQYSREHENAWVDGADAFVTAADVDAAMSGDWVETPSG